MTAEHVATAAARRPAARRRARDWWWRVGFVVCGTACYVFLKYMVYLSLPSFSVRLAGYDGVFGPASSGPVPAGDTAALSPAFNLTLRPRNTCVDRAEVTVLYSGVALGWARVAPRDCAGRRWEKAVEVAARGEGIGLSQHLLERMSSEWRSGTAELDVDVKVFGGKRGGVDSGSDIPTKAILCKVAVEEQATSSCTWSELRPIVEL
ncbi:hypothetical protein ACP70R_036666 [Stipagrostis hirtigluma subsp. patula]